MTVDLRLGDCREVMAAMPEASVDSIVCDPPYGLSFMGLGWDHSVPGPDFWREALRVAKPGAHLVAFGGTRTYHRLTCAIEDAGWEVRDCLSWMYGTGFPKSLDVSKALDKAVGAEREVIGRKGGRDAYAYTDKSNRSGGIMNPGAPGRDPSITAPATDLARQWSGWGTALKPAWEPIILARKPMDGTVAANVARHGVGGINVDGCLIAGAKPATTRGAGGDKGRFGPIASQGRIEDDGFGRWPANVCLDEKAAAALDEQSGVSPAKAARTGRMGGAKDGLGMGRGGDAVGTWPEDPGGGASRFFATFPGESDVDRLVLSRAMAILSECIPSDVRSAGSSSSLPSALVASVVGHAVALASRGAKRFDGFTGLGTVVTQSEFVAICESVTEAILSSESASSQGSPLARRTLSGSHARYAVRHEPTGTTTITICPSTSDGSAVGVTLQSTSSSLVPGGPAWPDRFRYCAKASRKERGEGNDWPTVKPLALMRWLCRLVTPAGGVVLDPFHGSGSTLLAARDEGFRAIGIDMDAHAREIALRRLGMQEAA